MMITKYVAEIIDMFKERKVVYVVIPSDRVDELSCL
jgi:uncharacterized protein YqgV (UPF0045/DUF77 family)